MKECCMIDKFIQNPAGPKLNQSNYQTYVGFQDNFIKTLQSECFFTIVEFLEDFSKICPLGRGYLVQAFSQLSLHGRVELANECGRIHAETSARLLREARIELGLPPIYEFVLIDASHVSIMDQVVFTKTMLDIGTLQQKPVLKLNSEAPLSKQTAFLPYLEDVFELVGDSSDGLLNYDDMVTFSPFAPIFYSFSEVQYGHSRSFFYNRNADSTSPIISPYNCELKDITLREAEVFLQVNNVKLNNLFIVLYFSEDQEINNPRYKLNPCSYIEAIDYLINQGLQVIRIGSSRAHPIPQRLGLIDLTQIERPTEVDIFLCCKAFFYLGSSNGPYSIAHNFGVPIAEIARFDYGGVRPRNFVQYLSFFKPNSHKKYTFSEIKTLGLNSAGSLTAFEAQGILPDFPTSQQNLKFVLEALQYFDKNQIFQSENFFTENYRKFNIQGDLATESQALLN